ncbi:hypothetical protein Thiofri_04132 [Thiorhodovibrio frisius]|nr:hypothetical protein [Thiorhodovibrio frisius]WPL23923.1 hypothetical protein Thiofri_04132 [Thiorhodovibrio frisius]
MPDVSTAPSSLAPLNKRISRNSLGLTPSSATLKTASGAYHALDFAKYGTRYLSTFAYRFNRRFHLDTIHSHTLAH